MVFLIDIWTSGETKFLLDKYHEFMDSVGPRKQFRNKKAMWSLIASEMNSLYNIDRSYEQVKICINL